MADSDRRSWWFTGPAPGPDKNEKPPGAGADPRSTPAETAPTSQGNSAGRPEPAHGVPPLPSISLPKGGGAIRGIGEKLTVGAATGTASLGVPVFTSPAQRGPRVALSLQYDSGAGNGPYGLGWSLSAAAAVSRKTTMGLPRYDDDEDSDVFILAGAEDLVPMAREAAGDWIPEISDVTVGATTFSVRGYRPRVEAGFARIERWQNLATGETHWRTVSRENVTSLYGQSASSRITDPDDPTRVFSWLLDLTFDDRGNAISYQYKAEDSSNVPAAAHEFGRKITANRYLKRIFYGNRLPYTAGGDVPANWCFEIVFDYGEHDLSAPLPAEATTWPCRSDPFSTYRAGFEVRTYRLCRRVLMFHLFPAELGANAVVVRSTDLTYSSSGGLDPQLPDYTLLSAITQTGWLSTGQGFDTAQLPPLTLGYSPLAVDGTLRSADDDSLRNLRGDFGPAGQRWVDLMGEGLQGLLTEDEGAWYYKRNLSTWNQGGPSTPRFAALDVLTTKPVVTANDGDLQLVNLNGDGHLCAVNFAAPSAGWFEVDERGRWEPLRSFATTANVDWSSPDLRFVDLDGDGLADVLITEDDAFTWYQWVVDTGFAPSSRAPRVYDEDAGPALVFADGVGSIFLADMTGDGLTDLVRIRNGEIVYWPNLGYGRFGAKVVMDGVPVFDHADLFDPQRIKLGDIDGSGTTDLAYVGSNTTSIWFNQSGNEWTQARELPQFPPVDDLSQASVFDLLGTGTAAAVWTSPLPADSAEPLRYIDLTDGTKPYLLTSIANNLGASTTLTYAPSTAFYVQDETAGKPWLTRLPFPVHVVVQRQVDEAVSRTSLVSSYTYHHGFYDPAEREFRGFARVDQLDAEALPKDSGTGEFTSTPAVSGDEFTLPPVWTRTWYHTGAFFDRRDIARGLAEEYYPGDPQAPHLGSTALPASSTGEELREACRALRGRILRQEIYAQDGSPAAVSPYVTTEHRYEVDQLQPAIGSFYGSYYAWELEAVTCHYERDPTDPRVTHELTLAVDPYGNATASASVGYPRRNPVIPPQGATLVTYTEADYANVANQPGFFRLGLPVETRRYELTGVAPTGAHGLYDHDALGSDAAGATVIPYEAAASAAPERRLLACARTYYRSDDLQTSLARGVVDSLGLVDRTYQLVYTPGLLYRLFVSTGKLTASTLASELAGDGAFVDLDGDGNQWAPSSRILYSGNPASPDPVFARQHFYLPQGSIDPWGNVASVAYDGYDLFVTQTKDPVGNLTVAKHNYRVLATWLATDPNQNRSGVRFDAMGMVVAAAEMGKLLASNQDEGDHLETSTAEASPSDDPTTRLEYDLSAFEAWAANPARDVDHPVPAWVHTLARVTHNDPQTEWLETYSYSDGLGRVALTKAQAEPGEAPQRDPNGTLVRDANGALVFAPTPARWVGTGRVVYDNKGNPVKTYEPFFDSSPVYDDETDLVDWGVTSITRYDPLSRAFRVDNPNGTFHTLDFDPWGTVSSDENDTVLNSVWYGARQAGQLGADELDAATKAAADAATPTVSSQDTLGRVCQTVLDNAGAGPYTTVLTLDIEGHTLITTDALGREVLVSHYCPGGREAHRASVDAGERWMLHDAAGQHLLSWDSRQHQIRCTYDASRRPTGLYVTTGAGQERLAEQIVYGEGLAAQNLCGAEYQHQDEAGLATTVQRDFKGNVLVVSRELLNDYVGDVDWSSGPALTGEIFSASKTFDALNRVTSATSPDGSVTTPAFNERNLLAAVSLNLASGGGVRTVVQSATYDAKGQRLSIAYGNGVSTAYTYDRETFRLTQLTTTRPGDPGPLQDLAYTYDPVGNATRLHDGAHQPIFFNNQVVLPSADYTYDAVYRLVTATGREQIGLAGQPQTTWNDTARVAVPLPTDGQAMRNYTENYTYDAVGNFLQFVHTANLGNWTRTYAYDEPPVPPANNQLTSTTVNGARDRYTYDAHGNISMPHLSLMEWDWKDQLHATASRIVNGGTPETTYHTYDTGGQRVVKATNNQSGRRTAERIYLGAYEVYRTYDVNGKVTLERHSLHVSSTAGRICLFETTTVDVTAPPQTLPDTVIRYQLANHLGSAILELDAAANIITYEEYYPYGSTSLQSGQSPDLVSLKRYRYTGKERDTENGFYYHGARYYASWLGRWTEPDPVVFRDGRTPYGYVQGHPTTLTDPSGMQEAPSPLEEEARLSRPDLHAMATLAPPPVASDAGTVAPPSPKPAAPGPRPGPVQALPPVSPVDYRLYVAPGFVYQQYEGAIREMVNPDNPLWARGVSGLLAVAAAPLAAAEEYVARPIVNIPFTMENAGIKLGEHAARAYLNVQRGETGEAVLDTLGAIASFSQGFTAPAPVVLPLAGSLESRGVSVAAGEALPEFEAVQTPYGPATQALDEASLAARQQVAGGARLWRVGTRLKSQAAEAQFWSLENPTNPGFAARYGIPPENVANANFIESATLKPGASFVTRAAPPVGPNPGGGIEVVANPGDVQMRGFSTGPW